MLRVTKIKSLMAVTTGIHDYDIPLSSVLHFLSVLPSCRRRDITVYTCMCCMRGSLVCRPQIYGALTLAEESSFSSPARNTDKRNRFSRCPPIHPDLSLIPSDVLQFHAFMFSFLDLSTSHHPHTHFSRCKAYLSLFLFPFSVPFHLLS